MGFSAEQVDDMSLWQLSMCIEGWNRHHSPEEDRGVPLSDEQAVEIGEWLDRK